MKDMSIILLLGVISVLSKIACVEDAADTEDEGPASPEEDLPYGYVAQRGDPNYFLKLLKEGKGGTPRFIQDLSLKPTSRAKLLYEIIFKRNNGTLKKLIPYQVTPQPKTWKPTDDDDVGDYYDYGETFSPMTGDLFRLIGARPIPDHPLARAATKYCMIGHEVDNTLQIHIKGVCAIFNCIVAMREHVQVFYLEPTECRKWKSPCKVSKEKMQLKYPECCPQNCSKPKKSRISWQRKNLGS